MHFPFYIAKKYTLSKKDSKFITFISTISIIGIALGVAALIIALSILRGFQNTITQKIVDFDSHIKITSYRNILPDYRYEFLQIKNDLSPYLESVVPFASNLGIISSKMMKEGVNIKGIYSEDSSISVSRDIISGKYDLSDGDTPAIVIGKKLANKLYVKVGDSVVLFALNNNKIPSMENPPMIMKFRVSGIFESGMAEYDDLNAYINLKSAQRLFNIGDNINGFDIKLNNVTKIDSLTYSLSKSLGYPNKVRSIYQTHRNIFTWIELQKKPIPIILGLIIIVAVFNIIGTLLMIVLEKTNAIGTLRSLGANRKQIITIFVYQGLFLGIIGIFLGNFLAFGLMIIQLKLNIITIPSSVYFMSAVPISLSLFTFILVSAITLALCIAASFIPSYVASKIQPTSMLRFG